LALTQASKGKIERENWIGLDLVVKFIKIFCEIGCVS